MDLETSKRRTTSLLAAAAAAMAIALGGMLPAEAKPEKSAKSSRPVSAEVRRSCANDYFAHCSMHPVGSPGVRMCMRAVGPKLSKGCIGALVKAGEVTTKDRKRYKSANTKQAKR